MTEFAFTNNQIQQIAKVLGDADEGISHSEIDSLFRQLRIKDTRPGESKWKRIAFSLIESKRPNVVTVGVIESVLDPVNYGDRPAVLANRLARTNQVLVFASLHVDDHGKVVEGPQARTLDEAAELADSVLVELRRRDIHERVLMYCETELLVQDLFHGVHEATKGVLDRLRTASGLGSDGADLVDECFRKGDGIPLITINPYNDESDVAEHTGFATLLKGVVGHWRNPTSHRTRIETDVKKRDVLDALTIISYIHRVLDTARNMHEDTAV